MNKREALKKRLESGKGFTADEVSELTRLIGICA